MNQITKGRLALKGSAKLCENPLPKLRARAFDKELKDVGLLESERVGFGHCTGQRLLPCREQDGYDRARTDLVLDTAVLENSLSLLLHQWLGSNARRSRLCERK